MTPTVRKVMIAVAALALAPFVIRTANRGLRGNAWQAYLSTIRSDLRNLAAAEEAYFLRSLHYAPSLALLGDSAFQKSPGVTVEILTATDTIFEATGSHSQFAPDALCSIRLDQASSEPTRVICRGFTTWAYRPRLAR